MAAGARPSLLVAGGMAGLAAALPASFRTADGESLQVTGVAEDDGGVTFRAGRSTVRLHFPRGGGNALQNAAAKFWGGDAARLHQVFAGLGAGALLDVTPKFHRREGRLSIEPPCSGDGFCPSPKHQIFHLYKAADGTRMIVLSEGFVQVVADSPAEGGDPTIRIEQGPSRPAVSAKVELCGRPAFAFVEHAGAGAVGKNELRRIARRSADIIAQAADALRAGTCS